MLHDQTLQLDVRQPPHTVDLRVRREVDGKRYRSRRRPRRNSTQTHDAPTAEIAATKITRAPLETSRLAGGTVVGVATS